MDICQITTEGMCFTIGGFCVRAQDRSEKAKAFRLPSRFNAFAGKREAVFTDWCRQVDQTLKVPVESPLHISECGLDSMRVYNSEKGYIFRYQQHGCEELILDVTSDYKAVDIIKDITSPDSHFDLAGELGRMFSYAVLTDAIVFHGAAIEYKGTGILICAASGVGKSTHAALWRDYENAIILNGDRGLCRETDGGIYLYGSPWYGSSGECINRRVPLSAIVLLERGDENHAEIMPSPSAFKALACRAAAPLWDYKYKSLAVDKILNLCENIPCVRLCCKPDPDAVTTLKNCLIKTNSIEV
ncbi:MAG: hypothetical protein VB118_12370 [Oscillospiraceae bacterium]|nr:hypothetical protein [Oscillospiraceae bacterium]